MEGRATISGSIVILGEPHDTDEYRITARELGYNENTLAMCQDHDSLHVALCKWLGLGTSFSMLAAVGKLPDDQKHLAAIEEAAVLAVQRFMKLSGGKLPVCP